MDLNFEKIYSSLNLSPEPQSILVTPCKISLRDPVCHLYIITYFSSKSNALFISKFLWVIDEPLHILLFYLKKKKISKILHIYHIFNTWNSKTRQMSKIQLVHHITVSSYLSKMICPHLLLIHLIYLSLLKLGVWIPLRTRCTQYNIM